MFPQAKVISSGKKLLRILMFPIVLFGIRHIGYQSIHKILELCFKGDLHRISWSNQAFKAHTVIALISLCYWLLRLFE